MGVDRGVHGVVMYHNVVTRRSVAGSHGGSPELGAPAGEGLRCRTGDVLDVDGVQAVSGERVNLGAGQWPRWGFHSVMFVVYRDDEQTPSGRDHPAHGVDCLLVDRGR